VLLHGYMRHTGRPELRIRCEKGELRGADSFVICSDYLCRLCALRRRQALASETQLTHCFPSAGTASEHLGR
jgi:hypothetical protein